MPFTRQGAFVKKTTDLPDVPSPTYTATQIKDYIQNPSDELMTSLNNVVDKLNSTTNGDSGADNLGATGFDGTVSNPQAMLEDLNTRKADKGTDWTGTWQGYTPSKADPGISSVVDSLNIGRANALNPIYVKTYDGSNQAVHPKVLYFSTRWNNNNYWMAYTPYPFSNDDYENPCIAVSNDGVRWFDPTGVTNPLAQPTQAQIDAGGHYSDTHLLYRSDTNTLECWYRYNVNNVSEEIYRRTTTDGTNWTPQELMASFDPSALCLSPAIIFENGKYKMWFVRPNDVMYMESTDGKTWSVPVAVSMTLDNGNTPWHVDVVHTDIGYEMLLCANTTAGTDNKILLSGVSSDGINWGTLVECILPSPNKKAWDSQEIYRSTFVKINGVYYVYYSALASYGTYWHIGLTTGDNLQNLASGYTLEQDDKMNTTIPQNLIMRANTEIDIGNYGAKYTEKNLKLVNPGVSVTELKPTDMQNTMDVYADGSSQYGYMRMAGVQFADGVTAPSNIQTGMVRWFNTEKRLKVYQLSPSRWFSFQTTNADTTVNRPTTNLEIGLQYFDTTLGKPIWVKQVSPVIWVDATGATV